jgi:hypothetical protein
MTEKQQRWFNTRLWPDACRAQNWRVNDRDFKLRVVGEIIGRAITTTKDVGWGREFDTLKNELLRLARPDDLNAALRTVARDDGAPGGRALPAANDDQRKRWLHKLTGFAPSYVAQVVRGFSRGLTADPAALDDAKLKAVVVTVEERARVNHALRRTSHALRRTSHATICHPEPVEGSAAIRDDDGNQIPF